MEPSASGEVFQSEVRPNQIPEAPVAPAPSRRGLKIIGGALVILLAIATAYLLTSRRASQSSANTEEKSVSWLEYKNPDGFVVSYPSDLTFNSDSGEFVFPGEKKLGFSVKTLDGPLVEKVTGLGSDYEFYTIDSRTGFEIKREDVTYYYFPLFGENYLEIVSEESGDLVDQIVSGIKFTPPSSQS